MRENNTNPISNFLEEDGGQEIENLFGDPHAQSVPAAQPEPAVEPPAPPAHPPLANEPSPSPMNPFDTFRRGQMQSWQRLAEEAADNPPVFCYEKVEDPIEDETMSFEQLRQKYQSDFPGLSDPKTITWTVSYGKIGKTVSMPGSTRVYDVKKEIEQSPKFLEGLKTAKKDTDKHPRCMVKPSVAFQKKGEVSGYKEFCTCEEEASASQKPLVLFPGSSGAVYQMRKTDIGTFVAPAVLPEPQPRFDFSLPPIPICLLYTVVNFFRAWSDKGSEVLVHVLYDPESGEYVVRVPRQTVTKTRVYAEITEPYPDQWLHVMDIHSHNTMEAVFSATDNADERETRLYAVIGRLDQPQPDITVRAACGGSFIPVALKQVFDVQANGYPYPADWDAQILSLNEIPAETEPAKEPEAARSPFYHLKEIFGRGWRHAAIQN